MLPYAALHKFCLILFKESKQNEHNLFELQCKVKWLGQRVRALDMENMALKEYIRQHSKQTEDEIQISPESP